MSLEELHDNIGQIEIKCNLCKESLLVKDAKVLSKWAFHIDCYSLVLYRLDGFMDIVLLPQDEFDEWMEDEST